MPRPFSHTTSKADDPQTPLSQTTPKADDSQTARLVVLLLAISYRWAKLGTGFLGVTLALAVIQAPIVTLASGGSLQHCQTISASVSDARSFTGRFFFALCTFGAFLNMMTLQTFILTPPDYLSHLQRGWCGRSRMARWLHTAPMIDGVLLWPLGPTGLIRFIWLAAQSFGLYLLANIQYTGGDGAEDAIHNAGAALAFVVSFAFELFTLSVLPAGTRMVRRWLTRFGTVFAAAFLVTQARGCTGFEPPDVCAPPMGVISYLLEMAMCLSLAAIFVATAFEQQPYLPVFSVEQAPTDRTPITQAASPRQVAAKDSRRWMRQML